MRISYAELWLRIILAGFATTFLAVAPGHTQTTTGRILGSVHDQQDAAIAGAAGLERRGIYCSAHVKAVARSRIDP